MATRSPRTSASATDSIQTVKHNARRKNIPSAGIKAQGQVQEAPRMRYAYNRTCRRACVFPMTRPALTGCRCYCKPPAALL